MVLRCVGIPVLALVDSGSEVSCISEEYYEKILAKQSIPTLPVTSTHLRGAMGQRSCRIQVQVSLQFVVEGLSPSLGFGQVFLVVKRLMRPAILGTD